MSAGLLAMCIADLAHGGTVRAKLVRHHDLRISISLRGVPHEFLCRSLIPGLRETGFEHLAFIINRSPEVASLPTDFYKHLV